jgi:hypothetical protein
MATTGYQAGTESNSVVLSYIDEVTWGALPATPAFRRLRYTSETLGSQKARQRATEIDSARQAADMVTTSVSAGGTINGALSIGTYDDLWESLFCSQFTTDIMTNGTVFQSVYLQKQLGTGLFLRYPGSYVTAATVSAALGGFVTASFTIASQTETSSATDAASSYAADNTNRVINTVSMTGSIQLGGTSPGSVESFSLDFANDGAAALFAIGSATAAGMLSGVFTVTGRIRVYFKDFTLYTRYSGETEGKFNFTLTDGTKSYLFEVLNSVLMNPQIVAGGPGQAVIAEYAIEGKKDSGTGKTCRLTRALV